MPEFVEDEPEPYENLTGRSSPAHRTCESIPPIEPARRPKLSLQPLDS